MGSCISKCKPKKKKIKKDCCSFDQDFCHVHDKLVVISQAPAPIRKPVSPSPSAASSTSFSSVSGGIGSNSSSEFSTVSSLSSSSSASVSKDRSFSNEFLWACARENPHVIGRNVIRGSLDQKPGSNKYDFRKQGIPESPIATPKKRARANSPTLVRQKSFRREPDKVNCSPNAYHLPNRTPVRSPSPNRRFTGESFRDSRKSAVPKSNARSYLSSSPSSRRENFKIPESPSYDLSKTRNGKTEVGNQKELAANQDVEAMVIEDINNPLIALDCFIFL